MHFQKLKNDFVTPRNTACGNRVEHPRLACCSGSANGLLHGFDAGFVGGAHVYGECRGDAGEIFGFAFAHNHRGRGSCGKQNIGRKFLHDFIGNAVNERTVGTEPVKHFSGLAGQTKLD